MPPPLVCIKFYIQPSLSLVVIFLYAHPLVSQPSLQVIIAQSLKLRESTLIKLEKYKL